MINFANDIKVLYWWIKSGCWVTMASVSRRTQSQVWSITLTCILLLLRLDFVSHYLMNWTKKNSDNEFAEQLDYKPKMKSKAAILFRAERTNIRFGFCVWFCFLCGVQGSERIDWVDGYHAVSHCAVAQQWPTWESLAGGALNQLASLWGELPPVFRARGIALPWDPWPVPTQNCLRCGKSGRWSSDWNQTPKAEYNNSGWT